jgi:hypothetical protein
MNDLPYPLPTAVSCTIGPMKTSLACAVKMVRAFCVQNRDFWSITSPLERGASH